jgi:hypothetical protein
VPADPCFVVTISPADNLGEACNDIPPMLEQGLGPSDPASLVGVVNPALELNFGAVAPDVAYFIVTFHDGQRLKLIPVTAQGHRYIAWAAPPSLAVDSVVAYLGGPYSTSGLTATTTPFHHPGWPTVFGLWRQAGQPAPAPDPQVVGSGTTGGHAWNATAYEVAWGTCFLVTGQADAGCLQSKELAGTTVVNGWGGNPPGPAVGSAAPGVALVRVTLSNGQTVAVRPVSIGNERLFAFALGKGVTAVRWTAYNAAGQVTGTGAALPWPAGNPGGAPVAVRLGQ